MFLFWLKLNMHVDVDVLKHNKKIKPKYKKKLKETPIFMFLPHVDEASSIAVGDVVAEGFESTGLK